MTPTPNPASHVAGASPYEIVAIKFQDIPDVINRRKMSRTFQSRCFCRGDKADEAAALDELWKAARRFGFTKKEIVKIARRTAVMP